MAAEDEEKAAKVAAARKRYEQLKKKKAGGGKKAEKEEKVEAASTEVHDEEVEESKAEDEPTHIKEATAIDHNSSAAHSRMRSESFKQGLVSSGLKSPSSVAPGESGDAVADVYKRQVARIHALEEENRRLQKDALDKEKLEGELEELRESQAEAMGLKKKANAADEGGGSEVERLKTELSSLRRQITTLQSQSKRRPSISEGTTEDLHAQLQAKQSTIEALELDMSNLRHTLFQSSSETSDLSARISQLEAGLATSQAESQSLQNDLSTLRAEKAPTSLNKEDDDPSATILTLTSQLTTATTRIATLEKKIDTLSSLHRDSEARNTGQTASRLKEMERLRLEAADMRRKLQTKSHENARLRASSTSSSGQHMHSLSQHSRGASLPGEEVMEEQILRARIRELEEENAALIGSIKGSRDRGGNESGIFDDVDLSPPAVERLRAIASPYAYGAFANVSNIINSFTGTTTTGQARGNGGFSDSVVPVEEEEDEDEDEMGEVSEEAFRAAAEEEAKQRIERVRETKRGLDGWRGWRLDLVDLRGGVGGGVFEV